MNVKITQLDGKLPNLALMKLSAWFKSRHCCVVFNGDVFRQLGEPDFDRVYASSIFTRSTNIQNSFIKEWPQAIVSGTGTKSKVVVEDITGDFQELDYSAYPNFKASIGFSQRGCRLNCPFCVVPRKEGKVVETHSINEIWRGNPYPKHIHLLDNDFFGQPSWREKCNEIIDGNFKVCFNQGINVRLIHKEGAELLSKMQYRDDQFISKRIYTAWDNRKDEAVFMRGIRILTDAGINPTHIMVYMLCGYWSGETFEDVMYRFETMKSIGLLPYPMVYDDSNTLLKRFQRWVIRRYHEFVPWDDYMRKKQEEYENQLTLTYET